MIEGSNIKYLLAYKNDLRICQGDTFLKGTSRFNLQFLSILNWNNLIFYLNQYQSFHKFIFQFISIFSSVVNNLTYIYIFLNKIS